MNAEKCVEFHLKQMVKKGIFFSVIYVGEKTFEKMYGTHIDKMTVSVGKVLCPEVIAEVYKVRSVY